MKANNHCEGFGSCNLPSSFPYNPVLYPAVFDNPRAEIISFGFPSEGNNQIRMIGVVGYLLEYFSGTSYFKDKYFVINWTADGLSVAN